MRRTAPSHPPTAGEGRLRTIGGLVCRPWCQRFVSFCNRKQKNWVPDVTDRDVCQAAPPFVSICNSKSGNSVLQSIKGCGFALAAAFASEVGDFSRFRSGRQVTAYFGLAPKQRSSADSVRLGGISGAGNALVRRLAVEGSWSYVQASHQPKLMPKGSGVPLEVRMHGRKGSERLLRRREEMLARGMPQAKANAATAAELVRWLWALGAMCREATE